MEGFYGNWKVQLDKTTGVAEIGKLFGWPEEKQKMFAELDYTMLLEASGDKNRCFLDYGAIKLEFFFTLGQPFDYSGADGTKAKCTVNVDGGKLVEDYVTEEGAKWRTVREVNGPNMVATTVFADAAEVKCKQELVKV